MVLCRFNESIEQYHTDVVSCNDVKKWCFTVPFGKPSIIFYLTVLLPIALLQQYLLKLNVDASENGNVEGDEAAVQPQCLAVQQAQIEGGPSGDIPNTEMYSTKPKSIMSINRKGKISNSSDLQHWPKVLLKRNKISLSWPCKLC